MNTQVVISMLKGTPWYVYGIFAYLVFIGIRSTKPYTLPLSTMAILPISLSIWLVSGIFKYQQPLIMVCYFLGGLCVGMLLGHFILRQKSTINFKDRTVTFEGTWTMLPLLMSVFVVKYAFGYMNAIQHPFILAYPWVELLVSGCIAGLFIGRVMNIYYRFLCS